MSTASGEVRRGHLLTEQANPLSTALDTLSSVELVQLFCEEDRRPQEAVAGAASALAEAVEANKLLNIRKLSDVYGRPVLLFPSEWRLNSVVGELSDKLGLRPHALAPDVEERRRKK